jgi:hypothetical protein
MVLSLLPPGGCASVAADGGTNGGITGSERGDDHWQGRRGTNGALIRISLFAAILRDDGNRGAARAEGLRFVTMIITHVEPGMRHLSDIVLHQSPVTLPATATVREACGEMAPA